VADTQPDAGGSGQQGVASMTVPPPPGPGAGDFFGAPSSPPPTQYGYVAPLPLAPYTGFGAPAAGFAAPRALATGVASTGDRTPELVVVACTLLGVFAAIGLYVAAAVVAVSSSMATLANGLEPGSASSTPHVGTYGIIWGLCGAVDIALLVFIRRGDALTRIVASVVCGGWTIYWLHLLLKATQVSSAAAAVGAGSIVSVLELLLVGMAVASALPAVVLWLPTSRPHFA
jgi:hypothetical protein